MPIEIKNGNILDANEKLIVQQVNCLGKMGAGLALQIKNKYPEVFSEYYSYCKSHNYSTDLLGKVLFTDTNDGKLIANIFGQHSISRHFQQTNYLKLLEGFSSLNSWCKENTITEVAIPYGIGCGLGGGEWYKVKRIIEHSLTDIEKITLYKL